MTTYDLLINRPIEQNKWVVVTPSLGITGSLVSDDIKVVQRVSTLFLTELGSVKYNSQEGSSFYQLLSANMDENMLKPALQAAVENVLNSINDDDRNLDDIYNKPMSEIVTNIEIVSYHLIDQWLIVTLKVIVASGDDHEFKLPVPVPIR